MAANLYARSIFGEDALANLSIERLSGQADGPVTGHIRIRAKSQVSDQLKKVAELTNYSIVEDCGIDGLVKDYNISIADAVEILRSCAKLWVCLKISVTSGHVYSGLNMGHIEA